jgi:hypothetical protein
MGIAVNLINFAYLASILIVSALMIGRYGRQTPEQRRRSRWLLAAVVVLILGDVVHIVAYARRTLTSAEAIALHWGGYPVSWVGLGSFATSLTLSFFYLFALVYRQEKTERAWTWLEGLVVAALAARAILLFFPQNNWGGPAPTWRIVRNIPFAVAGFILAGMFLRAETRWMAIAGWSMVVSFTCYLGTVLFVDRYPIAGMLMLPKMIAYVVTVVSFYKAEF